MNTQVILSGCHHLCSARWPAAGCCTCHPNHPLHTLSLSATCAALDVQVIKECLAAGALRIPGALAQR